MKTPIPSTVPVMVLPDCTLFPHAILPLFIFEQRYREMLKATLETDRMFCIGCRKPGGVEANEAIYAESTVGMIRACVGHSDGTSHLVLQGLHRVRFVEWFDELSYPRARIEPIESLIVNAKDADTLASQLLESAMRIAKSGHDVSEAFQSRLGELTDPEAIADVIGASFITETRIRQELLVMTEVESRLELIISHLDYIFDRSNSAN